MHAFLLVAMVSQGVLLYVQTWQASLYTIGAHWLVKTCHVCGLDLSVNLRCRNVTFYVLFWRNSSLIKNAGNLRKYTKFKDNIRSVLIIFLELKGYHWKGKFVLFSLILTLATYNNCNACDSPFSKVNNFVYCLIFGKHKKNLSIHS